jgi:hypothetical protein
MDAPGDLDLDVVGMLEPLRIPGVILVDDHFPLADRNGTFCNRACIHIRLQGPADNILPFSPAVQRDADALRPDDHQDVIAGFDIVLFESDLQPAVFRIDYGIARGRIDRFHPAVHEIDIPDECRDKLVCGTLVDFDRGSDLLDQTVLHDDEPIGDRHGFELVMGHEDGRDLEALLEFPDLLAHDQPQVCIEVGERLVEQQDLRLEAERPGEGDTLLLTAGELVDHPVSKRLKLDHFQEVIDPLGNFVLRPLIDLQSVADVFRHRHMGKEGIILEADPRVPQIGRKIVDPLAVEDDIARTDIGEAADQPQERRLPAAAGANERYQFALFDLQRYAFEDLVRSIKFVDVSQNQHRFFVFFPIHVSSDPFRRHTAADFFVLPPNRVLLVM